MSESESDTYYVSMTAIDPAGPAGDQSDEAEPLMMTTSVTSSSRRRALCPHGADGPPPRWN